MMAMDTEQKSTDTLEDILEMMANAYTNGQYAIMKNSTYWTCSLYTPENEEEIWQMSTGQTKREAIKNCIAEFLTELAQ